MLSILSHWAVKTVQSVTGSNVAKICQEFGIDPLVYGPTLFFVKKKNVLETEKENLNLLQELLHQKKDELDPDMVSELGGLINDICKI